MDDANDSVLIAADGDDDDGAITVLFGEALLQSGRKETSLARFGIFPRSLEFFLESFLDHWKIFLECFSGRWEILFSR